MDQQFLFRFDLQSNPASQTLPNVFKEHFYNGEKYIFIHGNNRYRYICLVRDDGSNVDLYGDEWAKFVEDNVPSLVRTLHFVKEAESTFYVTCYDHAGIEGPGYEIRDVGSRVSRCLVRCTTDEQILQGDFLQNILKDTFIIYVNGMSYKVKHKRVQLDPQSVVMSNQLYGKRWDKLVADLEIVRGQMMVFTNLGRNKLNLATFLANGTCIYEETILPMILRLPCRPIPPYAIKDKRAKHSCSWEGHTSHNNENDVFYAELTASVFNFYHLTIPVDYCSSHSMHTYQKAILVTLNLRFPMKVKTIPDRSRPLRVNHVKINGNWRAFGGFCGFTERKMMRLKLVNTIVEVVEGEQVKVAEFHVC